MPTQGAAQPGPGKGKGNGKAAEVAKGATAPDLAQLPAVPHAQVPPLPKQSAEQAGQQVSEDRKMLETLLSSLAASGTELAPEMEQLVRQYKAESHKLHGKQLHQLVAKQTQARRELTRVNSERLAFERSWGDYINRLVKLLQEQMEERQRTMDAFAESENSWQAQLQEASSQLAQSTATTKTETAEPIDVDKEEDMVDAAIAEEAAHQQSQAAAAEQYAALLQSLQTLQAPQTDKPGRDGSRTPRRQLSEQAADGSKAKVTLPADGLPGSAGRGEQKTPPK